MCQSSNKTSYYIKTLDINVGNDWEQAFFSFHLALCDMQLTSEVLLHRAWRPEVFTRRLRANPKVPVEI